MSHLNQRSFDSTIAASAFQADLCLRTRQLALLAGFGVFAAQDGSLKLVLQEACRVAAEGTEAPFAALLGYRPDERSFVLEAGVGWQPSAFEDGLFPADLASTAGLAWHIGQPLRFGPSTFDGMMSRGHLRASANLAGHSVCQMVSVPIRGTAGAPFGVLEVGIDDMGEFTQADLSFVEAISNTVAAAVRQDELQASRLEQAALAEERHIQLKELRHRIGNDLQSINGLG